VPLCEVFFPWPFNRTRPKKIFQLFPRQTKAKPQARAVIRVSSFCLTVFRFWLELEIFIFGGNYVREQETQEQCIL
jgi:hypothetical protein